MIAHEENAPESQPKSKVPEVKKDVKKKKKTAKKMTPRKPFVRWIPPTTAPERGATSTPSPFGGGQSIVNAAANVVPPKKNPSNPETLEDWENYLLNPGSYEATNKLIARYQARLISDVWFFTLVDKLSASKNPKHHAYALVALSAAPSYDSFERLSDVRASDPEGDHRQIATTAVFEYQDLEKLNILRMAIHSDVPNVRADGIAVLKESAKINLSDDNVHVRGRTFGATSQNARYFQSFEVLLSQMAKTEVQPTMLALIKDTLTTLQTLLKPTQIANTR